MNREKPSMKHIRPSPSYSLTLRLEIINKIGMLGRVISTIGKAGGDMGAVDLVDAKRDRIIRDLTVNCRNEGHGHNIVEAVKKIRGVKVLNVSDRTFHMHLGGKIEVTNKTPIKTRSDLSMSYTPGVARVAMAIHEDRSKAYSLTIKNNTVAVVSDGTAVLGLGDIGPEAALPVMEGKAMLFKEFGGVDAFPLCLDTKDVDEIVAIVKAISPNFGGINLEDISAPRCFEIEERLKEDLDIPVFHDDQHGTAVVVLAALINALKIVGKRMKDIKVVVNGVGAAGSACIKMLLQAGVGEIIACDKEGILYKGCTENMDFMKEWVAKHTNPRGVRGSLADALKGADLFLGLSAPNVLKGPQLRRMKKNPIVFAMANPVPEIMPEEASRYAKIVATGRSDYPNQINNVLCFPGLFRGVLDCRAREINDAMKMAAARAIASIVPEEKLSPDYIIPGVFNKAVAPRIAEEVKRAADKTGAAHSEPKTT